MAIESTDFILYHSVIDWAGGFSGTQIAAINNIADNGGAISIGGIGNNDKLVLNFITDDFNIPDNATIVGYQTKIVAVGASSFQPDVTIHADISDDITSPDYFSSDNLLPQGNSFTIDSDLPTAFNIGYGAGGLEDTYNNFIGNDTLTLFEGGILRLRLKFIESTNSGFCGVSFNDTVPTVSLKVYYEIPDPPSPTKVKLNSESSVTDSTFVRCSSTPTVPLGLGLGGTIPNILAGGTGEVVLANDGSNSFYGGRISFKFNELADHDGNPVNLSEIWDDVVNVLVRFVYRWGSETEANSNYFRTGWTGAGNDSAFGIVYDETETYNDGTTGLKLYANALNGDDLASLKQDLNGDLDEKLRFIIYYQDDDPNNSITIYGQGPEGGAVVGGAYANQPSVEFQFVTTTGENKKYKAVLGDTTILGPVTQTEVKLPLAHAALPNTIVDDEGNPFAQLQSTQADRILGSSTGAYTAAITSNNFPRGIFYYNCFTDEIPLNARILGAEIVATTIVQNGFDRHSYVGSGGTSGTPFDMQVYLINGTEEGDNTVLRWEEFSGITLSDNDTRATFDTNSVAYKNQEAGDDVLFSTNKPPKFTPAEQANWGFGFAFQSDGDESIAVFSRGLGLRITYQTVDVFPRKYVIKST
jgi:hypothetical protein